MKTLRDITGLIFIKLKITSHDVFFLKVLLPQLVWRYTLILNLLAIKSFYSPWGHWLIHACLKHWGLNIIITMLTRYFKRIIIRTCCWIIWDHWSIRLNSFFLSSLFDIFHILIRFSSYLSNFSFKDIF